MDAFDTIILTNAKGIYPACSFYLDISAYESKKRFIKRESQLKELQILEDRHMVELSESTQNQEQDRVFRETTNWLSGRYPFFPCN